MTDRAITTRPRLSSEERKASIVKAAMRLFADKGFRGTTTRELAAAVGVSEPVLYEHFKTKSDLYDAIIDTAASGSLEALRALTEKYDRVDDDLGFFTELGNYIVYKYTEDPTFFRLLLFSNLEGHGLKESFFKRQVHGYLELITRYIAQRIEKGAIRSVDPMVAARSFAGMIGHYAMMDLLFGCGTLPYAKEEVVKQMAGIFVNGLCEHRT